MSVLLDVSKKLEFQAERFAAKTDLRQFATKADLQQFATKHDLRDFATKNDLELVRNAILDGLKPMIKAVDKDAETVVDHERRIGALERKTAIIRR